MESDDDVTIEVDLPTQSSVSPSPASSSAASQASSSLQVSKAFLEKQFRSNDSRLVAQSPKKRKRSEHWTHFKEVNYDGQSTGFAQCTKCKSFIPSKSGTASLKNHRENCRSSTPSGTRSVSSLMAKATMNQVQKNTIYDSLVRFVLQDARPFSTIEGEGFLQLLTKVSQLSSSQGAFDFTKLSINRRSLGRIANDLMVELKEKLISKLESAFAISISLDHWTETHTHKSYLGIMCHFLDGNKFATHLLSFREAKDKTADGILNEVNTILNEYKIKNKVAFVCTDGASANKKAFSMSGELLHLAHPSDELVIPDDDESEALPVDDIHLLDLETTYSIPRTWMRCHSHEINNALKRSFMEIETHNQDIKRIMEQVKT